MYTYKYNYTETLWLFLCFKQIVSIGRKVVGVRQADFFKTLIVKHVI